MALLIQEPLIDTTRLPPAHPNLILLTPTPTRPRCATYVKRLPGITAETTFQHGDSFLGVEISVPSAPPASVPASTNSQERPIGRSEIVFTIYNFYSPGRPSHLHSLLDSGFVPARDSLMMGDFNAHHRWWAADSAIDSAVFQNQSRASDAIASWLERHQFSLQNEVGRVTHYPRNGMSPTVIDLCLTRGKVTKLASVWSIDDDTSTDHSCCRLVLGFDTPPPPHSALRRNWKLANWSVFSTKISSFEIPPLDTLTAAVRAVTLLTDAIHAATDAAVPLTTPRPRYAPWWSQGLTLQRRQLLQTERRFRRNRSADDRNRCVILRERWRLSIAKAKTAYWARVLETCGPTDVHRTIRRHHQTHLRPIPPIAGKTTFEDKCAALHQGLFPAVPTTTATHTFEPATPFSLPPDLPIASTADLSSEFSAVSNHEVSRVLRGLNAGSAVGPDKISYTTIRQVHSSSPLLIPKIFTSLLTFRAHPVEWKTAICVILPKKGKPDYSVPKAYRPISLLPCLGKVFERLVADRTADAAHRCGALLLSQMGARSGISSADALIRTLNPAALPLSMKRTTGQTPNRPALLTHDVQGAFDAVRPEILVSVLRRRRMPEYICDWVASFCANRSVRLSFDGQIDDSRPLFCGLPQGSPISPVLFLVYVAVALEQPGRPPVAIQDTSYVDDVNCLALGKSPLSIVRLLQDRTDLQLRRARPLEITFAPSKSDLVHLAPRTSYRLVSSSFSDFARLATTLPSSSGPVLIRPTTSIRYLGVIIDERLSFRPHALDAAARCRQSLNALRFLGGRRDRGVIGYTTRRHLAMTVLLPKMLWGSPLW